MSDISGSLHAKQERIDELHRCRVGRTALLVIDMQRGFLEPGAALEVPQGRDIIPNIRRLIEVCAQGRSPLFIRSSSTPPRFLASVAIRSGRNTCPQVPAQPSDSAIPLATAWLAPMLLKGRIRARSSPSWYQGPENW